MPMMTTGAPGGGERQADWPRAGHEEERLAAPATVLLVSRDRDVRVIFGAALRHAGLEVRELAHPDQVVARVLAERPSLVITDYPTPAGEATVTELLRGDAGTAGVPILNATTHVLPEELDRASAAGVSASLPLPVSLEELVREVRRLLAAARPVR